MTDQKPTGVFVGLPLSGEQIVSIAGWIPGSREELRNEVLPSIFSIIGTPVHGGKFDIVGWVAPELFANFDKILTGTVVSSVMTDSKTLPLVRQSDAQAAIAAVRSENVRLREILALFSEYEKLMDSGEDVAGMMVYAELWKWVHESLKGGAA